MKKTLLSLLASALVSLSLISGTAYASDDATSTLTDTTTQEIITTSPEVTLPEPTEENKIETDETNTEEGVDDQSTSDEIVSDEPSIEPSIEVAKIAAPEAAPAAAGTTWVNVWIKKTAIVNWTNTWNVWDTVTYTITYGNSGLDTASGVSIADSHPVWFVSTGWFVWWTWQTGTTLYNYLVGSLAAWQQWQIVFTGTILVGTTWWTYVPNIAQITTTSADTDAGDNFAVGAITAYTLTWSGCGCTGTWLSTGSFYGRVYYDNVNNAIKDGTDTYTQWVTVLIKTLAWAVVQTLTTDGNGFYSGTILEWSYVIQVLPLPGYSITTLNNETVVIPGTGTTNVWEDGLYKAPEGWSGGGGGTFGWGVGNGPTVPVTPITPTIPTTPTTPTTPTDLLPLLPSTTDGAILPGLLLPTWPSSLVSDLVEVLPTAVSMTKETLTTTTIQMVEALPIIVTKTIKPLSYVNVLAWGVYESALSRLASLIMYVLLGAMLAAFSWYALSLRRA
jgi:uncharacterized repeat protein (TIGR01451 family)